MSTLADPKGLPLQDVLTEDPRIVAAAFVAGSFQIDPIPVLAEKSRDLWRIRLACAQAWNQMNNPDGEETPDG